MSKELINFKSLLALYGKELQAFEIFGQETAHGKKCWTELNTRVIEHVSQKVKSKIPYKFYNSISRRTFEFCPTTTPASI